MRWLSIILMLSVSLLSGCISSRMNFSEGIKCFQEQNYRQAFIRLIPEAEKGNPEAQYAVGYMYYYGQGVVEDRKKAWVWMNNAAKAGHPEAIEALKMISIQ